MATPVRLQRYLAAAGVAARRKAEDLITAGRVTVNGEVVTVLGTKVDPDRDEVTVDGEAVVPLDNFYVLFNKPKACITAVTDDRGRMTVMDYLPNLPVPVKPVGRLDFYTEGVLLLTNDGELAARLLAPSSHVPKTYHVKVHGNVRPEHVRGLRSGVQLDDGTVTLPAEIEVLPGESKHTWLAITIHEGKHRQIHRMLEALGYRVDKLQRVAFANLTFHHLRVGDARELTQQELNELRDLVELDHSAVARGKWRATREQTDIPRRARAKAIAEADEARAAREAAAPLTSHDGESHPMGDAEPGRDDREDTWGWSDEAEPAAGGQKPSSRGTRNANAARGGGRHPQTNSRGAHPRGSGRDDARGGRRSPARDKARGGQRSMNRDDGQRSPARDDARGGQRSMNRDDARGGQRSMNRDDGRGGQRSRARDDARGGSRSPNRDDVRGGQRSMNRDDSRGGTRSPNRDDVRGGQRAPGRGKRSEARTFEHAGAPKSAGKRGGQGRTFGKRAGGRRRG